MLSTKGFTLLEVLIVMIIIGVLVALALPDYYNSILRTRAQTAENNLRAIAAAQQKYYIDTGSYCSDACGNSQSNLDAHLGLSTFGIDDFSYSCGSSGVCQAVYPNINDPICTITMDVNGVLTPSVGCDLPSGP